MHWSYVLCYWHSTQYTIIILCALLIQGGGGSRLFLEIIRPMFVLFIHKNILFGCVVVFMSSYTQHKLTCIQ